ncbi:hypothetical protein K431DRAFT_110828 [Polychaeton citri CBS 116435]|uniref:Uncharacterized protein n=1 Tax=Polychaeton citri CBS 116435 TaxID=1314669 RepID=A0A9P4UN82_9PEZI|nr:hypothetical protein K431DRAFT_110828 [Polychaeton citri CBS 116435]
MMGELSSSITVQTNICYGIFCSAKSYYVGLRCLARKPLIHLLVMKVAGDKLPQELCNLIMDELLKLEKSRVRNVWRKDKTFARNFIKFRFQSPPLSSNTGAWQNAWLEAQVDPNASGVIAQQVQVTRPVNERTTQRDLSAHYIHLSCERSQPRMAMNLPSTGTESNQTNGGGRIELRHDSDHGTAMWASCQSSLPQWSPYAAPLDVRDKFSISATAGVDTPSRAVSEAPTTLPEAKSIVAARLLVCDGVQESIRNWDRDLIEKFVGMLELHIVPFDDGDPLSPGLHIVQRTQVNTQIATT